MYTFWNCPESLTQMLKKTATIGGWVVTYLLGSYLYFTLTHGLVESTPALMIPLLTPLSVLSACVSWQIEREIEPVHIKPHMKSGKASILPLLYMSVFYSSVIEGFLYEWFLHGGLRPWLRIAVDLFWLSPFFTDAAATYVYIRLLGENDQYAMNHVSTRLPSFVVPLLGVWSVFSIVGNEISNPILSFMIFDFGIIVWTVFSTWANRVDLPGILRNSRYGFLRRLGLLNDILSRPLGRVYRWRFFGSYLLDLVVLIFSLAVASELWLADIASATTLTTIVAMTFAIWKGREFWTENHRLPDSTRTATLATEESTQTILWPVGIRLYSLDAATFPAEDAFQHVLKLDLAVSPSPLPAENSRLPM
jgi:hypothetical protein